MAIQTVGEPVQNPRWVMPAGANRIFVSIGVSNPGGGLERLPGAVTAAMRMAKWAQGQGYATLLLNDKDLPEITTDVLRVEITNAINLVTDNTELHRLVIYFAGHGAAQAVGDQYWILTNWKQDSSQAIKVTSLQRMLEYYGPRQVSLIGDACQEFSTQFIDIVGSAVLYRTDEQQRSYELDQFFAVDAGKQAFMIKAQGDQEDFCLFTEVLLDALEGDAQGDYLDFDMLSADKVVTSQSLARYLKGTVAQVAGKYGVQMNPCPRPGFYTDTTYLRIPWALGMPQPPGREYSKTVRNFDDYSTGSPDSNDDDTCDSDSDDDDTGVSDTIEYPKPGPHSGTTESNAPKPHVRLVKKARLIRPKTRGVAYEAQTKALKSAREASRYAFAAEASKTSLFELNHIQTGIWVSGADVATIQVSFGKVSANFDLPNWFPIKLATGSADRLGWCDTLVTLTDGRIVPVCVVNRFVASLHIIDTASLSLFHREIGASDYEGRETIELLAQAHAGLLSWEAIIDSASMLRYNKHRVIMLGCIAAQLYDVIRDVDSLRSMSAFYAENGQPVPLDIILYGGGTISEFDGRLYADIPAVASRRPRTEQEKKQRFTFSETREFRRHPIAGRIPWMRQAWGAVATARCDASAEAWREQALTAMEHLAPGLFTVAKPSGHVAFVKLAGIRDIQD